MNTSIEQDAYTVNETNGSVTVCVRLEGDLERSVMVNLTTLSDTAQGEYSAHGVLDVLLCIYSILVNLFCAMLLSQCTDGPDFTSVQMSLIFVQGTTIQCVEIPIMDDVILENDESFSVSLSTNDGAVNILQDQAVVTITDNDSMCNL